MNKINTIKKIFTVLSPDKKDIIRKKLSEKFNISVDTAKNHWIYNGGIPVNNIDEVYTILCNEAQLHIGEIKQLIDTI